MYHNLKATHIIADFYNVKNLFNIKKLECEMIKAAKLSNSTILDTAFHHFKKMNGVTGVVLLAQSHISIHTWPEISFVSIDAFMCGNTKPMISIEYLKNIFVPSRVEIKEFERGNFLNDTNKG